MEKTGKKRRGLKIALIVLAVLLVLGAGALAFAGNYLFRFALDPQFGGMISSYEEGDLVLEGKMPGSPKAARTAGSPATMG